MEAVAAGDDVADQLAVAALVHVGDARRVAFEIVHRDVGNLEQQRGAGRLPRGDQVLDDLLLTVDRHLAAGQLGDRNSLRPPVAPEVDALVDRAFAVQPVGDAETAKQIDRVLLEQSSSHASDVARATELTRASARRFLRTREQLGYVNQQDGRFSLTPRVLELGYAYLSSLALPEIARPHLVRLVAQVDESSSVSVLDGADVVYVARVPTRRIMRVAITVGPPVPRARDLDGAGAPRGTRRVSAGRSP